MNCKDFQHWLLTRDIFTDKENPDVLDHLKGCATCRKLYTIDAKLEENITLAFHQQDVPKGLPDKIEWSLNHVKNSIRLAPLKLSGIAAGIVLMVVVSMVMFNKPSHYQNLQQLSEKVIVRHLKGDMVLSFGADEIEQAVAMLSQELRFKVILPELEDQGYVLLGGRCCVLGDCKTAYLFYKKNDKICSLFIMDYGDLDFQMADGSRFSSDTKGCHTNIWKEKGQVYAMVY
jgi:anti-sigma factor RsiW